MSGWSAAALVSFGLLIALGETVLKAAHAHWPQDVLVGLGALAAAVAGLVKPLQDAVASGWSKALSGRFERERQRGELVAATAPGRKELQRVKNLDDARAVLGIHPCIPLPEDADPTLSREMPLYVPRDIHAWVTTWISAHEQTGGFLLLLGSASAGKTRCLYEALREKLPDAPILLPKDAAQVETFISTLNARGGPVVVWLNEIYDLLGAGQLTADHIRRALNHTRPLLIVGTMWSLRYDILAFMGQDSDLNRDAREILTRLCDIEDLPDEFSEAELDRAASMSTRDPRLHEAIASLPEGSFDITGTLAAKPRLLAHWKHPANPYEHAILAAAILAAQLGHPDPIPPAVLEPLALARLTPHIRAQAGLDWFQLALAAACTPLPGLTTAALEPRAQTPGHIDGYRPHDILTQSAVTQPSDADITTLIEHAEPASCTFIGVTLSVEFGNAEAAIAATRKAASTPGHDTAPKATVNLGILLAELGDTDGARDAYQSGIDTRHPDWAPAAAINLGILLKELGDAHGARSNYQHAIDTRHPDWAPAAAFNLGILLADLGDTDDARAAYQHAIDSQHPDHAYKSAVNLGSLLREIGDTDGSRAAYQHAINMRHPDWAPGAALGLGILLADLGDTDGARAAYQHAIDSQHPDRSRVAAAKLGDLLAELGDIDGARAAYAHAISEPYPYSESATVINLDGYIARPDLW